MPVESRQRPPGDAPAGAPPKARAARSAVARAGTRLSRWLPIVPAIVTLAGWEWASGRLIREIYVSRPTAVLQRLVEVFGSGEIVPHLRTTGLEIALGYGIGFVTGAIVGYVLGRSRGLARVFEPYVMAFYGIPKIAFAPLFIIWFGIGIGSKVALSAIMVFFLVFFNVYVGVRSVDRDLVNVAAVMGASQRQLTRYIYLPATMPFITMGARAALPYSVIGVIVGEFTSATSGLGLFMYTASVTFDPAGVFTGVVILLIFILAANALLGRAESHLLRWQPDAGKQSSASP
ncbi:MAG: ABC transporter permease [Euzebyales bacterium]|nr:ABC transporter permease [Euzebyales bacterium]